MKPDVELIDVGEFVVLHVFSNPQRIESKVVFDRDNISQKLIFTLMDICHAHGFSCSSPFFSGPDDPMMTLLIGTVLPTKRSINKYIKKIYDCLLDIKDFAEDFNRQLDFSKLNLTMFSAIDMLNIYPEQIAAVRDQHFGGSWNKFKNALRETKRDAELKIVEKCIKFEKINKKDIGLIGHKLSKIIDLLGEPISDMN